MRALLQCATHASVKVNDDTEGTFEGLIDGAPARSIDRGLVIFLGVGASDGEAEAEKLWRKISKLRIFPDENGKTNRSLSDVGGGVLIVSQFTLYADCRHGNRPSFTAAGDPARARDLYRSFVALAQREVENVAVGEFGADMSVSLTNEGPFTIWLDTDAL